MAFAKGGDDDFNSIDITVKGKVSNKDGPLAAATVKVEGTTVVAITDDNGNYSITAPEDGYLIFSYSGYKEQRIAVNNRRQINVEMLPSVNDLDEVVVVGYGAQHKKETRMLRRDSAKSKVIEDVEAVEPMGGWEEYDAYINSNKKKPSELSTIDGEVILSFDVNEKHEVSNIKIVKSLSQEQDKEAIRLVKEGPQWKSKKGKKGKAKLAIKF